MAYVNVPNDLSKIKTKLAFNLTKRQLICFGGAAAVGIPLYLLTRSALGNTGALFLMLAVMLPAFLLAMYERDGLPLEKVVGHIKTIKGKVSDIDRMKVEEQKKAMRAGYDPDILPPDLITFSKDAADLLADLQSRNERMLLLTFTVVNFAPSLERLENDVFTVSGIAQKYNCALKRLDWQQEQAYVSALALGRNEVEIQRGMTTSSTAIFIPFITRELRMDGQALYYGMNALSHNVIMADRKKLKSANGLYLGSTGSGKSFAAKRELINVFLATQDRIIVVDPMGEYAPLVKRLGGQVIDIAPDSPCHINPMDIQLDLDGGDSPLSMKADFLLSLCELVVGGKDGLQPIEKTVIDRCMRQVYRELTLGIGDGKMPLLQDLYEELLKQPEPEAQRVATALELYCTGSLNLFNFHTNVNLNARVVCIVLKGMGENLRKIAMHVTNEFVSATVNTNFEAGISTWCYFDEFHILAAIRKKGMQLPFLLISGFEEHYIVYMAQRYGATFCCKTDPELIQKVCSAINI